MTFILKLDAAEKSNTIEHPLNLLLLIFEQMDLDEILEKTHELDLSRNVLIETKGL